MDQGPLVTEQIEDGKRLLERLAEEEIPVTGACWIKENENGRWYLYLASPLVSEEGGTLAAYQRIGPLLRKEPQLFGILSTGYRAISPSSPVGKAVTSLHKIYPGRGAFSYREDRLGNVNIDEAYIYPPVTSPALDGSK